MLGFVCVVVCIIFCSCIHEGLEVRWCDYLKDNCDGYLTRLKSCGGRDLGGATPVVDEKRAVNLFVHVSRYRICIESS